jgi:hypothetical protein
VDVGEAGEGAVGGEVVGGDDHAGAVFDGEDGGASYDGGLGVGGWVCLLRAAGLVGEVGGVVGAVDLIAGLEGGVLVVSCGEVVGCLEMDLLGPSLGGSGSFWWFGVSMVLWVGRV